MSELRMPAGTPATSTLLRVVSLIAAEHDNSVYTDSKLIFVYFDLNRFLVVKVRQLGDDNKILI